MDCVETGRGGSIETGVFFRDMNCTNVQYFLGAVVSLPLCLAGSLFPAAKARQAWVFQSASCNERAIDYGAR